MRRGIGIALVIFGVATAVTGIWQLFPPFTNGVQPVHAIPAISLGILFCIHAWLNRKPLLRYFKGLGLKWGYIALGILIILWMGIGAPLMQMRGDTGG